MKKRILSLGFALCMIVSMLSACQDVKQYTEQDTEQNVKLVYMDELSPSNSDRYTENDGDSFIDTIGKRNGNVDVNGNAYNHGLTAWVARWNYTDEISWVWNEYDINGEYEYLQGDIVLIKSYNENNFRTKIQIIGDGNILYEEAMTPGVLPIKDLKINISNVNKLKISIKDLDSVSGGTAFGLADFRLTNGEEVGGLKETDEDAFRFDPNKELVKKVNAYINAVDEYANTLAEINEKNIIDPIETKKNITRKDLKEKLKITSLSKVSNDEMECVYDAIFDFYMAYYLRETDGLFNKKYYDTISVSDFSGGGFSAANKIVDLSHNMLDDLLNNNEYTGTYKSPNGTEYEITVKSELNEFLTIDIVNTKKHTSKSLLDTSGVVSSDMYEIMGNYVDELYTLYSQANVCSAKEAIKEVTEALGGFKLLNKTDWDKTLKEKVANTVEKMGLGKINDIIGLGFEVKELTEDWASLEDAISQGDVKKVFKKIDSTSLSFSTSVDDIFKGTVKKGSAELIDKAVKKIEDKLSDLKIELEKQLSPEENKFWDFIESLL